MSFTGFIAYQGLKEIKQRENYYDAALGRDFATNWHEVNPNELTRIELWWNGSFKKSLHKEQHNINFYQTAEGSLNGSHKTLSRTIVLETSEFKSIYTVNEKTGKLDHFTEHINGQEARH